MQKFPALVVEKTNDQVRRSWQEVGLEGWNAGDVVVEVDYSSLNYKDALAATGHPGVARSLPLVPGIDAVGTVIDPGSSGRAVGDVVLVADARFGTEAWGGYSRRIRVPQDWLLSLPDGLSPLDSMSLGTAGFTAAQCVLSLQAHGVTPESGDVVVSGATGGVGCFAVKMLSQLGYSVAASTGKPEQADWLQQLGAKRILSREDLDDRTDRPLLAGMWAGAVDTVGGNTLATIIRQSRPAACVTACGVVAGPQLPLTVYPFILRGVQLSGIDSAGISQRRRTEVWRQLAGELNPGELGSIVEVVGREKLNQRIDEILRGQVRGRVVVDLSQ